MIPLDQDGWLAQRINALKPGWRGRLRLRAPEEVRTSAPESIVGTVVDEATPDRDAGTGVIVDAIFRVCANYRAGRFVPMQREPNFSIRASQIIAIDPM
jgi:hypothetical protein